MSKSLAARCASLTKFDLRGPYLAAHSDQIKINRFRVASISECLELEERHSYRAEMRLQIETSGTKLLP